VVAAAAAAALFPSISDVPEQFPATVLWNFRIAALGTQLVLWTTIGVLFGALTQRRLARPQHATQPARPTTTLAHESRTD
jgi:predicted cobalt transporter CbtA